MAETPRRYTVDVVNFDEDQSFFSERRAHYTVDTASLPRQAPLSVAGTIRSFTRAPSDVSGGETPYSQPYHPSEAVGRIRKVGKPISEPFVLAPLTRQVTLRDRFMSMKRLRLAELRQDKLNTSIQSFSSDMQELFDTGRQRLRQIEASYSNLI